MRFVHRVSAVVGLLILSSSAGQASSHTIPNKEAGSGEPASIRVPIGNGSPVITDGIFSPGEWDDAGSTDLNQTVRLYFKQYLGVVFLGIRGRNSDDIGPSEISIAAPDGPIHILHVSAQLAETELPESGEAPPFQFGLTADWYANEQRRDMEKAARLEKEGKSPIEIIQATVYPSDGIEVAIRRSKIPGSCWRLRLGISYLEDGKPTWMIHPAAAPERQVNGWQTLCFE